jgi:formylglycine-generating enzyme required for sulfatase activity
VSGSRSHRFLAVAGLLFAALPAAAQNGAVPRHRGLDTISSSPSAPQRRALVIGNANYTFQRKLKNTTNDATDLAATLTGIGYQVTLILNVNQQKFGSAVDDFARSVHPGDTALVFYSGHAVEVDGGNYLLPIDFEAPRLEEKGKVQYVSMPASRIQRQLQDHKAGAVVLILDACRENPYAGKGSAGGGLANMSGRGVYIAFAAEPGKPADDNPYGRNGYFTKHLLSTIREPGLTIDEVFNRVRAGVDDETKGEQVPFSNSGLIGRFVFRDAPAAPTMPAPRLPPASLTTRAPSINPKDGLEYVWIPPGTFMMGCSPGDSECYADEKPAHRVTLTKGFRMGVTAVTQEAYQRVMRTNPSNFKGAKLPVETVNWTEAQNYCSTVGMRLPTEAEWEYAARAGTTGARYGELDSIAWYDQNSGSKTHEVGQKAPNAWGLYDMLGNVFQWTGDWYAENYQGGNETDPKGPASGQYRTLRGGSWGDVARWSRASYRVRLQPDYRLNLPGFRCVGE